jgi:hypothetical protein
MMDEASPICSTGFQPVGRPGILPGQSGEERAKMPVGLTAKMAVPQPKRARSSPAPVVLGIALRKADA